jgi:hypothetical protein
MISTRCSGLLVGRKGHAHVERGVVGYHGDKINPERLIWSKWKIAVDK